MSNGQLTGYPLSPQQAQLWPQARQDHAAYWAEGRIALAEPVDLPALEHAVAVVLERHEILRTAYRTAAGLREAVQVIRDPGPGAVAVHDLTGLPPADRAAALDGLGRASRTWTEDGPAVGFQLVRTTDRERLLLVTVPALSTDVRGLRVLLTEIAHAYRAPGALADEVLQYADYAAWRVQTEQESDGDRGRSFWRSRTTGERPGDERPPGDPETFRPATFATRVTGERLASLRSAAEALGVGLEALLFACWRALHARLAPRRAVRYVADGRTFGQLAGAVGLFEQSLPVDVPVRRGQTLGGLARSAAAEIAEVARWQDYAGPETGGGRDAATFRYGARSAEAPVADAPRPVSAHGRTGPFRFELDVYDEGDALAVEVSCDAARHEPAEAEELSERLDALLAEAARRDGSRLAALDLRTSTERVLEDSWNATRTAPAARCAPHLVAAQAAKRPEATALLTREGPVSYRELSERASRTARMLRDAGVRRGDRVGLFLEPSADVVAAVLGVWWAGAAYVAVSPADPPARAAELLDDAGCGTVLTREALRKRAGAGPAGRTVLIMPAAAQGGASGTDSAEPSPAAGPDDVSHITYTSGTTGRPSGVVAHHRGVANYLSYVTGTYRLEPSDVTLQLAPVTFDAWLRDTIAPLTAGAAVVVLDHLERTSAMAILEAVDRYGVTRLLHTVPTVLRELLRAAEASDNALGTLRTVLSSGEPLHRADCERVREAFGSRVEVVNQYGPTECTMTSTYHRVRAETDTDAVPLGHPIANARLYLLDEQGVPVPAGVLGELYIGGSGVTYGYLRQPRLTAERFVPDPFGPEPGRRLYRTGDLARYGPDGRIEYAGRRDHQVKIRGVRVEPAETEAVLAAHPAVREAAVVALPGDDGPRLVAWTVPDGPAATPEPQLRAWLAERLPAPAVPAECRVLPTLPRTPHGKTDRRALAAAAAKAVPEGSADGSVPSPEGPRNALEENVVRIFAEVLQADRVGVNDSFFDLGGHSLLATRAVYELGRVLDVQLPLRSIFDHRTPAELAALVGREYPAEAEGVIAGRQLTRGGDAPSGAADAARSEADRIPKVPADRTEHPVSFSQRRMWLVHALRPDDVSYHVQVAVRIRGPLDPAQLRRTLELLADRHDALRTAFGPADGSGEPVQRVAERVEIPLPLTELPGGGDVQEYLRTQTDLPFDLSRPPLVRAGLARLSDEDHVLALTMHHIIVDEWSVSVLLRELTAGYASLTGGRPPQLAELPVRYVDFATWQRRHLAGDRLRELEEHWRRELAGAPFEISLPFDRERPAVPTGRGGRVSLDLDQELAAALSVLAGRTNTTLFMVLLAAFATLLRHHSGQQDLVIGTPVANRPHHEVQDVVGFFSNVVVLRNDLSGDPAFEGLLARTRDAALRAYAHQELPFEKLVEALRPDRALGRVPLVQTWFVLHNAPLPELRSGAAVFELLDMDRSTAKFDLNLGVTETDRGLVAAIEYSADLFDQATADRLLRQYRAILGAAARTPGARLSEVIRQSGETDRRERSVASAERRQASLKSFSAFASNKVKAIQVAPEKLVTVTRLRPEQPLPVVIEPAAPDVELAGWISTHRGTVTRHLRGPGSVLFRGFGLAGVDDFQKVVQAYSDHMLDYYERSTPRQEVSGKVYTSTEYPPERHIPLHNESAYSHFWPRTLWFCCLQEPGGGGATPLADSRTILKLLDEGLVRRFRERKVMYVRNYHEGFDIPWQVAFQTEDREAVAAYCRRVGMDFEWTSAGVLRTRQIFDAVVRHPETGEQVWFNQVYASHVSALDPESRSAVREMFAPEDLPRNVLYGDGSPIADAEFEAVREAYREATISFPWQRGDALLVDNMLVAHGREPYQGSRKVVVAMTDPCDRTRLAAAGTGAPRT